MSTFDSLRRQLSASDRRLLVWLLPMAALLLVVVVLRSLWSASADADARLTLALEDVAWLQAQAPRFAGDSCGDDGGEGGETGGPASLAARFGVTLDAASGATDPSRLVIAEAPGNQVLAFIHRLECRGHRLRSLSLDSLGQGGRVRGEAVFVGAVTNGSH